MQSDINIYIEVIYVREKKQIVAYFEKTNIDSEKFLRGENLNEFFFLWCVLFFYFPFWLHFRYFYGADFWYQFSQILVNYQVPVIEYSSPPHSSLMHVSTYRYPTQKPWVSCIVLHYALPVSKIIIRYVVLFCLHRDTSTGNSKFYYNLPLFLLSHLHCLDFFEEGRCKQKHII